MLKVFLVEDEYVVREGIKNNIAWADNDFIFCGEASDGELAYPMILEKKPDIIITDIKMPFIDGLELTRLIKNELPKIKIIILSGFEEFEYAREAIKLGVSEYLLKPINGADLLEIVKQVADTIMVERNEKAYLLRYQNEMEENRLYLKRRFLKEIMEGRLSSVELIEKSKILGMDLSAAYYKVMMIKTEESSVDFNTGSKNLAVNEMDELIESYDEVMVIERSIAGDAFLLKADSEEAIETLQSQFLSDLESLLKKHNMNYAGGMGLSVRRLSDLKKSYHEAEKAYAARFTVGMNKVLDGVIHSKNGEEQAVVPFEALELGSVDFKRTEIFLKNGHTSEIQAFVDGFMEEIGEAGKQSILFKQYILMNQYITVLSFVDELTEKEAFITMQALDEKKLSALLHDHNSIRPYMIDLLESALKLRDKKHDNKYGQVIERATKYIKDYFQKDDLTLNELADHVGLSPSHFSTVFSNGTGKSFIRYLTDIRVQEAKTLLKCTDMRCSDIAQSVGYKDPHYFSYLFKKEQGLSPMQFRSGDDV